MTSNTDPVRALIAKWRYNGHQRGPTYVGAALLNCADELESALASAPPSAVPVAWATEDKEYFSTKSAADRHVAVWDLQQSPTPLYLAPPTAQVQQEAPPQGSDAALASAPPSAPVGVIPGLDDLLSATEEEIREFAAREGASRFPEPKQLRGWARVIASARAALSQQPAAPSGEAWRPMASAPRDGTLVRLLVEFEEHATEDEEGPAPTIGSNSFDNTGDDEWQFAGWSWEQDCYTSGVGTPVGWLPMLDAAPQQPAAVDDAAAVLADLHPFLFGLKLAAPNEEKRAFIQERIDAVRRASAALAAQQQGGRADG